MSILALTSNTLAGTAGAGQIEYNGQFYATDSNASRGQLERLVQSTAQNSTSGTSIDFTGIPSWAKRITVMLNGVSTSGTSSLIVQIGSSSFTTSGYLSYADGFNATPTSSSFTTGFGIRDSVVATELTYGNLIITNISSNSWVYSGIGGYSNPGIFIGGGSISISGVLDRVRITTVNGTDTFDAGSINIMYEG